jgi:carboxyl-terminal processing protease
MEEDAASDRESAISSIPDSLKYRTDGGRLVLGGGGIVPDFIVYSDTLSPLMQTILAKGLERSFVRDWLDKRGSDFKAEWSDRRSEFFSDFVLKGEDLTDFVEFAGRNSVTIREGAERTVLAADEEPTEFTTADLAADTALIKSLIKGRIAWRIYDRSAWYPVYRTFDSVLQEAMLLWREAEEMAYTEAAGG